MDYKEFLNNPDFSSPYKISKWMEDARTIIINLLRIVDRTEKEKAAAIKELDRVAIAVDEVSGMIDSEVHPMVDYNLYLMLRENVDAISVWEYETEWRGLEE